MLRRPPSRSLSVAVVLLGLALAGAGCKKEPTRWDKAAAEAPPTPSADAPPKKAGASLNGAFPADGAKGFTRVFTAEKTGYSEAKFQKDGKDVATMSISDASQDADAKAKFASATLKHGAYPMVQVGKNKTAVLVKDRYQISVTSQTLDAAAREDLVNGVDFSVFKDM